MGLEKGREPIDKDWDDEKVIPSELSPETAYLFRRMTEETLRAVHAKPGQWVLDVGCGRGFDLASQAATGAILVGCDGSSVMVRRAVQVLRGRGIAPRIVQCSAENLPFVSGKMDIVYCKGAIDHFYDPVRALKEMERVLRPGGRLVVSVANFESLSCKLGRICWRLHKVFRGVPPKGPKFWQIPEDHIFKFDRAFLRKCFPPNTEIVHEKGVSLFWGMKRWGWILGRLPEEVALYAMGLMDRIARVIPQAADVLVVKGTKLEDIPKGNDAGIMVQNRSRGGVQMRLQGLAICIGSVLAALLFVVGVATKSYWALAIPVAIGFFWLLGLAFWIGWTLLTIRTRPPKGEAS